jgi:hypothetical protein
MLPPYHVFGEYANLPVYNANNTKSSLFCQAGGKFALRLDYLNLARYNNRKNSAGGGVAGLFQLKVKFSVVLFPYSAKL